MISDRTGASRLVAVALLALTCACAKVPMELSPPMPACRAETVGGPRIQWVTPFETVSRRLLAAWCESVGPAGIHQRRTDPPGGALILVTWNVHAGSGDVSRLLRSLEDEERAAGRAAPRIILLLQEAMRSGPAVPARVPDGTPMPGRIGGGRAPVADVLDLARAEDLNAIYVPSMRNGSAGANGQPGVPEDRGNAILSNLPLSHFVAVELPFAAQRRVAVSAQVGAGDEGFRVVSLHLDTSGSQTEQAEALLEALARTGVDGPLIVAGDFNSAMRREAVIESAGIRLQRLACEGLTHRVFQLDHVLTSGLAGSPRCERLDKFGSDHTPLRIRLATSSRGAAAPSRPPDAAAPSR